MSEKCGIDFGTSNSSIGYLKEDRPVITIFDGETYIPSSIFFDYIQADTSYGKQAIDRYIDGNEGRIIWSPKNALGTFLINETTQVKNKRYSFQNIIQLILSNLKKTCETQSESYKSQVVCGRPVFFNDNDKQLDQIAEDALREILKKVGFKDIEFEYEPIAAAVGFERQVVREQIALIVDMGGGTSDFSVIRLHPYPHEKGSRKDDILSIGGVHIAGTDFDKQFSLNSLMPELGLGGKYKSMEGKWLSLPISIYHDLASWHKINFVYTHANLSSTQQNLRNSDVLEQLERLLYVLKFQYGHYLAKLVEKAKIDLSADEITEIVSQEITPQLEKIIMRGEFNEAIQDQVEEIGKTVSSTIMNSGLGSESIDAVFMTGGSSMIPLVREKISSIVPEAKLIEGDKFGSVAMGLTTIANERFK